jgi:hypothetical protein
VLCRGVIRKYSFHVSYLISLTVIHIHVFVFTADTHTVVYTGVGGFLVTALVAGIVFATLRYSDSFVIILIFCICSTTNRRGYIFLNNLNKCLCLNSTFFTMYYNYCEDSRQIIFQLYPRNLLGKSVNIIDFNYIPQIIISSNSSL